MLFRNTNDNEWLAADRRERRKVAVTVISGVIVLGGLVAFVFWAAFAQN